MHRLRRSLDACIWLSVGLLLVMFHPGGMSIDSYTQLAEARSGRFGDWHPPFMAWLWRAGETIVQGPLPMLLAQLALFLASLWLFARQAFAGHETAARVFVLLTLWLTPVSGIVGVIWKDVWTSCLLLLAAALIWSIADAGRPAARAGRLLGAAAAMLCALLFRYNAVFAVAPLLLWAGWLLGSPRAQPRGATVRRAVVALAAAAVGGASLLAAAAAVNRALTAQHTFPLQSILIYDLAGVAALTGRTDLFDGAADEIPEVLRGRPAVAIEALRAHYFPSTWTPLVFVADSPLAVTTSASQVDALAASWRRALIEEPGAYLRHRAGVFRQVIGAHRGPLFAPVYFGIPADSPDYAEVSRRFSIGDHESGPIQRLLRRAFTAAATLDVHRPWVWLALNVVAVAAIAVAAIAVAVCCSPRCTALLALGASGLLYELALFFIAPSADFRYSHWLVLSTWALLATLAWALVARRGARGRFRFRRDSGTPAG